jgi:hypothetical protein
MSHNAEAAAADESTPSTERLRSEIEETRAEISETIDAIQSRLRPGQLINRATQAVKESTVERTRHVAAKASQQVTDLRSRSSRTAAEVLQKAKDYPVPASMVGLAVTGLLLSVLRRQRTRASSFRRLPGRTSSRGRTAKTIRKNVPFWAAAGAGVVSWMVWKSRTALIKSGSENRTECGPCGPL